MVPGAVIVSRSTECARGPIGTTPCPRPVIGEAACRWTSPLALSPVTMLPVSITSVSPSQCARLCPPQVLTPAGQADSGRNGMTRGPVSSNCSTTQPGD